MSSHDKATYLLYQSIILKSLIDYIDEPAHCSLRLYKLQVLMYKYLRWDVTRKLLP